jgi:hypothetical protein
VDTYELEDGRKWHRNRLASVRGPAETGIHGTGRANQPAGSVSPARVVIFSEGEEERVRTPTIEDSRQVTPKTSPHLAIRKGPLPVPEAPNSVTNA